VRESVNGTDVVAIVVVTLVDVVVVVVNGLGPVIVTFDGPSGSFVSHAPKATTTINIRYNLRIVSVLALERDVEAHHRSKQIVKSVVGK
jgi:hypothetical protein